MKLKHLNMNDELPADADEAEIAYILKAFPRTSETFITNEIYRLEQAGLKLAIFSVKRLAGQQQHGVVSRITATVTYLPEAAPLDEQSFLLWLRLNLWGFVPAHLRLLWLRPVAYLRTLSEALRLCAKHRSGWLTGWKKAFFKEFLQAGFIAERVVQSGRIRHLHAHFCHGATTIAMLAGRLSGLPYSFTAHARDIYQQDLNPGDLLPLKLRRARFAVTCTAANKQHLDRLRPPQTPLHAIYHGLDLSLFAPQSVKPVRTAKPVILAVGRMVEKKGFTDLIRACRLLKDQGHDFECRIVGGADKHTEVIKAQISRLELENIVTLQPAVTQEQLRDIYAAGAVFALPCQVLDNGDRDGIPNVLAEAMAMKLPVVSTRISGIPELIEHGVNGLLVPQKDPEALAAAIARLLGDPALGARLGEAARAKVCCVFDATACILSLKSLFDACLLTGAKEPAKEPANAATEGAGHLSQPA